MMAPAARAGIHARICQHAYQQNDNMDTTKNTNQPSLLSPQPWREAAAAHLLLAEAAPFLPFLQYPCEAPMYFYSSVAPIYAHKNHPPKTRGAVSRNNLEKQKARLSKEGEYKIGASHSTQPTHDIRIIYVLSRVRSMEHGS